ncbi:unnamed protein product [Musa acuminata subsp. burmannicoides]
MARVLSAPTLIGGLSGCREGGARAGGLLGDQGTGDSPPRGCHHPCHRSSLRGPRLVALHPRLLLLGPAPQSLLWRRRARQQAREPDDRGGDCIVYHYSWMILGLFYERF